MFREADWSTDQKGDSDNSVMKRSRKKSSLQYPKTSVSSSESKRAFVI